MLLWWSCLVRVKFGVRVGEWVYSLTHAWSREGCEARKGSDCLVVQSSQKTRGVFDDFSMSTVLASALTAATSFFLTSIIGLAGSLVGAIIAATISTVATQVYKGVLLASADRIKDAVGEDGAFDLGAKAGRHMSARTSAPSHTSEGLVRKLVIFGVIVSLACVVVSAAVVFVSTRGQGLGPTSVGEFVSYQSEAPAEEEKPAEETSNKDDKEASSSAETEDGKKSKSKKTTSEETSADSQQVSDTGSEGAAQTEQTDTTTTSAETTTDAPVTEDASSSATDQGGSDASSGQVEATTEPAPSEGATTTEAPAAE